MGHEPAELRVADWDAAEIEPRHRIPQRPSRRLAYAWHGHARVSHELGKTAAECTSEVAECWPNALLLILIDIYIEKNVRDALSAS